MTDDTAIRRSREAWDEQKIPVAACRDRMGGLERELTRVALTVEHLASAVALDRENAESRRKEILEHIDKSHERSEKVVGDLSAQIKSLVDNDLANRTNLAVQRAQWGLTRWVLTTVIAACGVFIAYQSGQNSAPAPGGPAYHGAPARQP